MWCLLFKQKTAYEMRISDWSSDVCSSDLIAREAVAVGRGGLQHRTRRILGDVKEDAVQIIARFLGRNREARLVDDLNQLGDGQLEISRQLDRKSTRLNSSH